MEDYCDSGTVYYANLKCQVLSKYECGNITVLDLKTPDGEFQRCVKEFLTKPVVTCYEGSNVCK